MVGHKLENFHRLLDLLEVIQACKKQWEFKRETADARKEANKSIAFNELNAPLHLEK
jgi:hypothetical protein